MNLTTGPAKKSCHKSAIGKFKTVVWNHAAISSFPGCLNKTVATRLMVGHIHKTIMHEMASVITNGRSFGVTIRKAIAARGRAHYKVYKQDNETETNSHIRRLTDDERVEEIAHMLSGAKLTEAALNNARALLEVSNSKS